MRNKTKNIFENINLNNVANEFCKVISVSCLSFWEQEVRVNLCAINDFQELRDEKLILNTDFFSSQIKIEKHKPVTIRLSREFIENFLELVLKKRNAFFELTRLTSLEIKILNAFCEFMYKKMKDFLIPIEQLKVSEKSNKNVNLIFLLSTKNDVCSKIMFSIPQDRFSFVPVKKILAFSDLDFSTSNTLVNLKAGSSKITLSELNTLAAEDIIVLENSDISKLTLISGKYEKKFNIKPKTSLILNLGEDDDEQDDEIKNFNEVKMDKNLWDDIQIEINAEFEKVKMTIGELKQISQGQIVDLGSIFDNEISLFVENKKVAKGELLIINDRYAVRLNEIFNSKSNASNTPQITQGVPKPALKPAQPQQKPPLKQGAVPKPPAKQPQPQAVQGVPKPASRPAAKPAVEDEDFDYSDFEK